MLYKNNQPIKVDAKYNSVDNPGIFRNLREKLENKVGHHHAFFRLEERVKLK